MVPSHYFYTETEPTESTTLRPYIDPSTPTNVTVIKGKTAMLACVVRNVGKAAVSYSYISPASVAGPHGSGFGNFVQFQKKKKSLTIGQP